MRALRRNAIVPIPAATSPNTRSATVTPVTLARRLRPRHHRVTASVFFARTAPPRSGGLARLEHVAEAALGLDQRLRRVRIDLAAKVGDIALDDPRVAVEVVFPDVVEDLRLRQYAVGVEHEIPQELELRRAQIDADVSHEYIVGVLVHGELAGTDHGLLVGLHRPP